MEACGNTEENKENYIQHKDIYNSSLLRNSCKIYQGNKMHFSVKIEELFNSHCQNFNSKIPATVYVMAHSSQMSSSTAKVFKRVQCS